VGTLAGERRRWHLIRGNPHAPKRFLANPVYSTESHPQPQRAGAAQMKLQITLALTVLLCLAGVPLHAQTDDSAKQLSRDIFKQLIEINTTDSMGSTDLRLLSSAVCSEAA